MRSKDYSWIEQLARNMPFYQHLGIRLVRLNRGRSELRLKLTRSLTQSSGVAHGGLAASLIDSAVGLALCTLVESDQMISTVEMNVNYLAPARPGPVRARGIIIQKGRRIAVGEAVVFNGEKMVAKGLVTYMILQGKRKKFIERLAD